MLSEQTWWNKNAKAQYETFKNWVGNKDAPTKKYSAEHCHAKGYESVADLGCADGTFYLSLKDVYSEIKYVGVDSCTFFVEMNTRNGIPTIQSDIRNIPDIKDSSVDMCYSRHTFEHQPDFETILGEMIRIGKKEACHIFFIKPDPEKA